MRQNLINYMTKKNIPPAVIEMVFKVKWENVDDNQSWHILDKLLLCEGTKTADYERHCLKTFSPIVR